MTMESGDARCSGGGAGGGGSSNHSEAGSEPGDYGQPTPPVPGSMEVDNEDSCSQDQTNNNTSAPPSVSPRSALAPSSREMRNRAEKQRRDKLNTYVNELAQLNPWTSSNEKKMDKTSVLRLSAAYIRYNQTVEENLLRCGPTCPALTAEPASPPSLALTTSPLGVPASAALSNGRHSVVVKPPRAVANGTHSPRSPRQQRPNFDFPIPNEISQQMLEDMDGFLMILSATGKIVLISQHITKLLGHAQNDLMGQSMFNITCPSDHEELRKNLQSDRCPQPGANTSSDESHYAQRRSFYIKLSQRATSRGEHAVYEMVHVTGTLRVPKKHNNTETTIATTTQIARKNKHRDVNVERSHQDTVLIAVGRLTTGYRRELSIMDATKDEYVTRHTLDGLIIYCDHRISVVAGYMAEEVSGLSAFGYMHKEDVRCTLVSLRQMYRGGGGFGSSVYRLLTKNQEFIYLRTHGHLEYDETGQKPVSFICINSLLSDEEGEQGIVDMRNRFAGYSGQSPNPAEITDVPFMHTPEMTQSPEPTESVLDKPSLQRLIVDSLGPSTEIKVSAEQQPFPDTQYVKCAMLSKSLPPPALQVAQLPVHRRESSSTKVGSPAGMSEPTSSPRPVVMRANGRTTSMCSMSPTDSLLGSVSPPPQPVHDPLLAGAQGTCYVRATRRREIISTATGTITIETATVRGQVTSSSVEVPEVSSRPRRRQSRLNNKRHLSGDEVNACTDDLTEGGGKRSCTEPPVRWEQPMAPLSPTARSVCSNDTDFSFVLDSSDPDDYGLVFEDLFVPPKGTLENEPATLTTSSVPQGTNPSVLRRDGLEETSVRSIHQLKSSKQQTDIGV